MHIMSFSDSIDNIVVARLQRRSTSPTTLDFASGTKRLTQHHIPVIQQSFIQLHLNYN